MLLVLLHVSHAEAGLGQAVLNDLTPSEVPELPVNG